MVQMRTPKTELEDSDVFADNPLTDEKEDVRAPDTEQELQVISSIQNSSLQPTSIIGNCFATISVYLAIMTSKFFCV
jgi:hypothetical protein